MWYPLEKITIATGIPLPAGSIRTFTNIFPLDGCGWYKIRLHLEGAVAAIVGPYGDMMYRWIKGITVRTSRGEVLVNNVPGMALYRLNSYLDHTVPEHVQPLAAGSAYIDAVLDIPFVFPFLNRKEDTILDTGRYSNLELQVTTGTLADLSTAGAVDFTAPGVTMCIELIRTMAALVDDGTSKPFALPYIGTYPLIHVDVTPFWDLESSLDLGLFGFFICNHAASARPFCYAAAAGAVDNLTMVNLVDNVRTWLSLLDRSGFRQTRQELVPFNRYDTVAVGTAIPTLDLGMYPHIFVKNGSVNEVYPTGKKNFIRLSFTDLVATDEADLCVFGMRTLR
jgi:hypothetical protein